MAAAAEQVAALVGIVRHVVELVGPAGIPPDELPLPGADHAHGAVLVEHVDALPRADRPIRQQRRERPAGQARRHAIARTDVLEERRQPVVLGEQFPVDAPRGYVARPADETGHLDAGVEHVLRPGRVALSEQAVVAHVHAVVADEHHQRVAPQVPGFEPVEEPSDVAVHPLDRREVAGQVLPAPLRFDPRGLVAERPRFVGSGHGLERAVLVVVVPGVRRMVLASPRRVGRGEMDVQAERPLRVRLAIEELERVVREEVRGVGVVHRQAAVLHHGHLVVVGRAVGHGVPGLEAAPRRQAVAQVPLARQAGVVAEVRQQLGVGRHAGEEVLAVGRDRAVESAGAGVRLPVEEVVDAVLGGDASGQEGRPGGRADRGRAEEAVETDSFARQPVEVRRPDLRVAGAAHRPGALVVRQDDQDVGAAGVAAGHGSAPRPATPP